MAKNGKKAAAPAASTTSIVRAGQESEELLALFAQYEEIELGRVRTWWVCQEAECVAGTLVSRETFFTKDDEEPGGQRLVTCYGVAYNPDVVARSKLKATFVREKEEYTPEAGEIVYIGERYQTQALEALAPPPHGEKAGGGLAKYKGFHAEILLVADEQISLPNSKRTAWQFRLFATAGVVPLDAAVDGWPSSTPKSMEQEAASA